MSVTVNSMHTIPLLFPKNRREEEKKKKKTRASARVCARLRAVRKCDRGSFYWSCVPTSIFFSARLQCVANWRRRRPDGDVGFSAPRTECARAISSCAPPGLNHFSRGRKRERGRFGCVLVFMLASSRARSKNVVLMGYFAGASNGRSLSHSSTQ